MTSKKEMTEEDIRDAAYREHWSVNEFGYLLAGRKADESQPRSRYDGDNVTNKAIELVKSAVAKGSLGVLPHQNMDGLMFGCINIDPVVAVKWAKNSRSVQPFRETFPDFTPYFQDYNCGSNTDQETSLVQSEYWQKLKSLAEKAIKEYPDWAKTQRKIQKSNLTDWVKKFGANNREAEIIKKIVTEIHKIP